ncbi:MAG TPA: hypothetical protein VL981_13150 [Candidatus Methylacidiphilales bacterium]|nr:hypothetical protein [Candidatus Methylacidiphilales bacterium]
MGTAASAQITGLDAIFVSQDTGDIDNIDTATGSSTILYVATGMNWNGAAYDAQNGLVYIDDIGSTTYEANKPITNTIYSFNPVTDALAEVGTITGQSAFTGAGFHNGLYYAIGSGSDDLVTYNLSGHSGTGNIAMNSSQVLGGLGTSGGQTITGVSLGDLDFVGNTLYISAGVVTSTNTNAGISSTYTLYKYTNVNNTSATGMAANFPISEGTTNVGVGVAYDFNSGKLIMFNDQVTNDAGSIWQINQTNGAQTKLGTLTGPAAAGGAGDWTIVPEPSTYAFWSMILVFGLVFSHRALRYRQEGLSGDEISENDG